jgi:hypothetical protein
MNAVLVRVGIDHSYGGWNAPADPETGQFVYVPIPEKLDTQFHLGCDRRFREVVPALKQFARDMSSNLDQNLKFPPELLDQPMHLDPDFEYLTYGDVGTRRGSHIRALAEDDLIIFYAGLCPCRPCEHKLIYALVGLFVVKEVLDAADVPPARWVENAHTRKCKRGPADIIVRAKPGVSGRFLRFVSIGEYRDRAYRVRRELLEAWGGLTVADGYIQRSARPPRFLDPLRFRHWLDRQEVTLMQANNPEPQPLRVIMVHLRRPKTHCPNEMRSDPFWEFGSFGCTRCHGRILMNPPRSMRLKEPGWLSPKAGTQVFGWFSSRPRCK